MNRITLNDLNIRIDYINKALGMPLTPYESKPDQNGRYAPLAGCYHLEFQNGYIQFVQMSLKPNCTGTRQLASGNKREVYNFLCAFIRGIEEPKFLDRNRKDK